MGATVEDRGRIKDLEEQLEIQKFLLTKERMLNNELKTSILEAIKELDTVGILHGAGSKQRAKEKLVEILKNYYGEDYKTN